MCLTIRPVLYTAHAAVEMAAVWLARVGWIQCCYSYVCSLGSRSLYINSHLANLLYA